MDRRLMQDDNRGLFQGKYCFFRKTLRLIFLKNVRDLVCLHPRGKSLLEYHFSSRLKVTLNLCLIHFKIR